MSVKLCVVVAMTKQFNALSGWVITVICTTERLKDRVMVLKKFLTIAEKLHDLGNYNSMMAILSGLDRGPVYRMKDTMAAISSNRKYALIYADIKSLANPKGNYSALRQAIKNQQLPVIPYLGESPLFSSMLSMSTINSFNELFLASESICIKSNETRSESRVSYAYDRDDPDGLHFH